MLIASPIALQIWLENLNGTKEDGIWTSMAALSVSCTAAPPDSLGTCRPTNVPRLHGGRPLCGQESRHYPSSFGDSLSIGIFREGLHSAGHLTVSLKLLGFGKSGIEIEWAREKRASAHRMILHRCILFVNEGHDGLVGMCATGLGGLRQFVMALAAMPATVQPHTFTELY
jgi:hypothetical protein